MNFATIFYTETRAVHADGHAARAARAAGGDARARTRGTTATAAPRRRRRRAAKYPAKDVTHLYQDAHLTVQTSVDVTYTARFSVGGGPWQTIPGAVTIAGPPAPLRISEATPLLSGDVSSSPPTLTDMADGSLVAKCRFSRLETGIWQRLGRRVQVGARARARTIPTTGAEPGSTSRRNRLARTTGLSALSPTRTSTRLGPADTTRACPRPLGTDPPSVFARAAANLGRGGRRAGGAQTIPTTGAEPGIDQPSESTGAGDVPGVV